MSLSYSCPAHTLKIGSHVIINQHPCKIINYSTSKPGKHGKTKIYFLGEDIFTGKQHEIVILATNILEVPVIIYQEYKLMNIDENGVLILKTDDGDIKNDIQIQENDIRIKHLFEKDCDVKVVTVSAMNKEQAIDCKIVN
ncbi:hypothetical protein ABK040_010978 [Willaertia magna]